MTSPYSSSNKGSSLNKDVYGHVSLLFLITAAIVLLADIVWLSLLIGSLIGLFLSFLYYQRIQKIPVHTRSPISDAMIALGGLISTIYLLNELPFIPVPGVFSTFSPLMAIGVLVIGIFSKLFLVEELFKGVFSTVNSSFNQMIKWTLRSRKNKLRVFFAVSGLTLIFVGLKWENNIYGEIITSISLSFFSAMVLLDLNQVHLLTNRRKIISSVGSLTLLSGIFRFSSDYNNIGNTLLGLSLLISSINRYRVYSGFRSFLVFIYLFFVNLIISLKSTIIGISNFIKKNIFVILRGVSLFIGTILNIIPSSNRIDLGVTSISLNHLLGWFLIILALLPTIIRWIQLYGKRIYQTIKNSIIFTYTLIYLFLLAFYQWILRNNRRLLKFISTVFAVGFILLGPSEYFLNYFGGLGLLGITYWSYVTWFSNLAYSQFLRFINYFLGDYSRASGYAGLFGIIISFAFKDSNPQLSFLLIVVSAVLLSLGWNFIIFRFIDAFMNFIILIFEGFIRLLKIFGLFIYLNITVRRVISVSSWILLIFALIDIFPINRWLLVTLWIIIWHLAYTHRITRVKMILKRLANTFIVFGKNLITGLINFGRRFIRMLGNLLKSIAVTIYTHTIVILLWAIGLFLLILGVTLMLPFSVTLSREIFGNVAKDNLISFIIGVILFSVSILSIQQTYLRREKLLIGEV